MLVVYSLSVLFPMDILSFTFFNIYKIVNLFIYLPFQIKYHHHSHQLEVSEKQMKIKFSKRIH